MNAQVDELITSGMLRRLLARTELQFSNSMIEAWWRSLKHQWLFLHALDSVTTVRRLVAFYVDEHNHVLPHSAFRGQTPDEMYLGTGEAVPADLRVGATVARQARGEFNRSTACEMCPTNTTGGLSELVLHRVASSRSSLSKRAGHVVVAESGAHAQRHLGARSGHRVVCKLRLAQHQCSM